MKPIHTWQDLEQFGIKCLTGEACAYSMRVLCDVSIDGATLLADYLGLGSAVVHLAKPWNSTVNEKPAVGSIMLDRDSLQRLAQFAFFRAGALAVVTDPNCVTPVTEPERVLEYDKWISRSEDPIHLIRNPTIGSDQPHVGSRNVHAFTGRVE